MADANKVQCNINTEENTLRKLVGSIWRHTNTNIDGMKKETYYFMCEVSGEEYCLVGLHDGNRWRNPSREFDKVVGKDVDFELVSRKAQICINPFL